MPGSTTTLDRQGACDDAPRRVAFRHSDDVGTQDVEAIVAQWLACTLPYRRFADVLANARARLGADVDRYSFILKGRVARPRGAVRSGAAAQTRRRAQPLQRASLRPEGRGARSSPAPGRDRGYYCRPR